MHQSRMDEQGAKRRYLGLERAVQRVQDRVGEPVVDGLLCAEVPRASQEFCELFLRFTDSLGHEFQVVVRVCLQLFCLRGQNKYSVHGRAQL